MAAAVKVASFGTAHVLWRMFRCLFRIANSQKKYVDALLVQSIQSTTVD